MIYPYYQLDSISILRGRAQRKINGMSVKARETCPVCGRTMVNIYACNGAWMCRKCLEQPTKIQPSVSPLERLVNDRQPSCPLKDGSSLPGCSASFNAANQE